MTDAAAFSEQQLRSNFLQMSVAFAINHGAVTTPLVVASSLLEENVAFVGSAMLYVATVFSALFLAAPLVSGVGPRGGLIFSMALYCAYALCFSLTAGFSETQPLAWTFFVIGSCLGGIAAGVLWTAQGGYFAETVSQVAELGNMPREEVSASLAGNFATLYLILEVASKLAFSFLLQRGLEPWLSGLIFLGVGAAGLVGALRLLDLRPANRPEVNPLEKVLGTMSLWPDPMIWLLSPTNLTFGFCAAFMNGYVNATFTKTELGKSNVALLAAVTVVVAAAFSRLFGSLGARVGNTPVIVLGATSFCAIPFCVMLLGCCDGWGWWLIILYVLQGVGRAVYEATNRAMFADFFTGPRTEDAFANCMLQSSMSFAASFFLQTYLDAKALATIVTVLSLLTPVSLAAATALQRSREKRAKHVDGDTFVEPNSSDSDSDSEESSSE